ncbi:HORMA domain-containing protein [Flammula alnicola]|nr:HORMA domain-containing protein [Flammula alnicola]
MQNQQTRNATQSISQTQSLAAVQTLLRAGLGTITYLRNLLPEDNFTRSHFTSIDDSSSSQPDGSQESTSSRTNVSGFRITTITRGYTDEADRILNYMEYGIFDALEKRYLRSFIFGIYLDTKDPTNIVEAYTFNFKYHMIPGSDVFVPVISLAEDRKKNVEDPVARAIKKGRAPTLKDVKTSVKSLLKTLIQAISNMDVLPRRRFATFKVFYTEETPPDYEPPHFEPGDVDRDKWFFMTHDLDEVPERTSIGKLETGHHSVHLNVSSITSYLPSSSEHGDDATFSGLTPNPGRLNLSPLQEAAVCKDQAEKQLEDAKNRNLVWPVEDSIELGDDDAEGDDDDEYIRLPDGHFEKIDTISPIGTRNENGGIDALLPGGESRETHFGGVSENVPRYLREMAAEQIPKDSNFEETQPLLLTQKVNGTSLNFFGLLTSDGDLFPLTKAIQPASTPVSAPSSDYQSTLSPLSTAPTSPTSQGFDPEMLKNMHINAPDNCDSEMLDLETQINPHDSSVDSIRSFAQRNERSDAIEQTPEPNDNGLDCECGIPAEDESCYCEGGCRKWFHLWLVHGSCLEYIYHAIGDPRIPTKFICFDCRVRADMNWELIKLELYPQMLSKFKDLALLRRSIKTAQALQSFSSLEYSKAFGEEKLIEAFMLIIGGDLASAGRTLKMLEDKDYVLQESVAIDDMGLTVATRSKKGKNGKSTANKTRSRKNVQKLRYVFNQEIQTKPHYLDYFMPDDQEVENRLLGLSEMARFFLFHSTSLMAENFCRRPSLSSRSLQ